MTTTATKRPKKSRYTGNEEILNGNRGYSEPEDEWHIFAETEKNGRIIEGTSSNISLA